LIPLLEVERGYLLGIVDTLGKMAEGCSGDIEKLKSADPPTRVSAEAGSEL
jgi:hypothetical protein